MFINLVFEMGSFERRNLTHNALYLLIITSMSIIKILINGTTADHLITIIEAEHFTAATCSSVLTTWILRSIIESVFLNVYLWWLVKRRPIIIWNNKTSLTIIDVFYVLILPLLCSHFSYLWKIALGWRLTLYDTVLENWLDILIEKIWMGNHFLIL